MAEFLAGNGVLVYLAIFFGKIIEISLDTVRVVMINRGEKLKAAIIGFVVVIIWIFIVSSIITDLSANYFKCFLYAVAYGIGNYVGVLIEDKLAIGLTGVQIIAPIELGESYADCLREAGYGVTMLDGYGYNATRKVLMLYMPRKKLNSAMKKITEEMPEAVVVVSDLKKVRGGYCRK